MATKKTPGTSREESDEAILDLLAWDGSIAQAARASGLSERMVRQRLKDPDFAAEVKRRASARAVGPDEPVADGLDADGLGVSVGGVLEGARRESSAKQVAANRRNAARSSGPKTEEGKRRSSQNSITHAGYAKGVYRIPGGLLAEDEDEFDADVNALWASLGPRDGLEARQAHRVIAAYLRLDRLDRFEAMTIAGESNLSPLEYKGEGDYLQVLGDHVESAGNLAHIAARQVLNGSMDQASRLRERALRELSLALALYQQLVAGRDARPLREGPWDGEDLG